MGVIAAFGVLHILCIIQEDPMASEMHTSETINIFKNDTIVAETSSNARTILINNYFAIYIISFINLYKYDIHIFMIFIFSILVFKCNILLTLVLKIMILEKRKKFYNILINVKLYGLKISLKKLNLYISSIANLIMPFLDLFSLTYFFILL